jgi:hypothetical protein
MLNGSVLRRRKDNLWEIIGEGGEVFVLGDSYASNLKIGQDIDYDPSALQGKLIPSRNWTAVVGNTFCLIDHRPYSYRKTNHRGGRAH